MVGVGIKRIRLTQAQEMQPMTAGADFDYVTGYQRQINVPVNAHGGLVVGADLEGNGFISGYYQ